MSVLVRPISGEATWMQTVGTVLLTVKRSSLVRMRRSAQDSRNVHGLLYLTAYGMTGASKNTVKG